MAKARLEFDLTDLDDKMEFDRVNKSLGMAMAIWEFGYNTKKKLEWELDAMEGAADTHYELLDKVYKQFWDILNENDVNIDKLIV